MDTNTVLKKIGIAFNLQKRDLLDIFELAGYDVNSSQVGAFMVAPTHKNFKKMEEAVLIDFLDALILYSRGTKEEPNVPPFAILNAIQSLAERGNAEALTAIDDCTSKAREAMESGLFKG
ncbi:DUF1456 family protein [Lentisphaera marina]|uniref:DUF1456 family protein n=1 Tax=Lentisphaera marina TaxID=1111041 RepID=UPI0023671E8B|nr:DUF1456 family protein [Lentisphaera marina]MDD7984225.1 DUF1456 family protein [Lentisphaera marina]